MTTAPVALEARNLSFAYGNGLALAEISFGLGEGELLALLGPNGSGKTTLLKLLLGVLKPVSGRVDIFSAPLSSRPPTERAKLIAYVSQQSISGFPLAVSELVALGRYPYGSRFRPSKEDLAAVAEALERTGAQSLAARLFTTLSGGERQKVLIARALAQSARILLLDEPTLHLDLDHQLQILAALKKLCVEKRITIVTVLHDVNLISLFADKALLMKGGTARAFGPVAEVVHERSIRDLLGVDMKTITDGEADVRYFLPRVPR